MKAETLLVLEDEELLGGELARHFRREGWEVVRASSLREARRLVLEGPVRPLVVLADMSLPDGNALDLLEEVRQGAGGGEWIFLTGYGSVPDSVRALRLGAYDFLEKPCPTERLDVVVSGAARSARAQRRILEEASHRNRRFSPEAFLGSSDASGRVRERLEQLRQVPLSTLVIAGETGTGKGLVTRILHYGGPRGAAPLVELNCAALPAELQESELFGHEPGAFTGARDRHRGLFEQANGGTLFLDEIGEMAPGLQAKLLKAAEDRRIRRLGGEREIDVDVQIFAASNQDLGALVKEGRFRQDLYHRLGVFRLELPPLRDRLEDLDELVPEFVAEFDARSGKRVLVIPEGVWTRLRAYSWPGNVRELRNALERCVLLAESDVLPERWLELPGDVPAPAGSGAPGSGASGRALTLPLDGSVSLDDMEARVIRAALNETDGNVTAAARLLGVTRQTLRYRIEKHGIREGVGPEGG